MASDLVAAVGSRCRATASYIPVHDDEITLNVGDLVQILYVYDDGWVLGKNKTSGEIGLLPGNFLMAASDNSANSRNNSKRSAEKRQSSLVKNLGSLGAILSSPRTGVLSPDTTSPNNLVQNMSANHKYDSENLKDHTFITTTEERRAVTVDDADGMQMLVGIKAPIPLQSINPSARDSALKKLKEHLNNNRAIHPPLDIGTIRAIIAGDSGIGRTSFIYSFLSCPKIVERTRPNKIEINSKSAGVAKLTEVRASTVPHRHQHEVVERFNLSFIEPVGLGVSSDAMRVITSVSDFHIWQFQTTDKVFVRDRSIPKSTLVRFLNAGTGAHSHIDVCIYGILHRLKTTDIQFIKHISPYTVLVPVILKSDTLTPSEVFGLKLSILDEFKNANVPCYGFGFTHDELVHFAKNGVSGAAPFAVYSNTEARNMTLSERFSDSIIEIQDQIQDIKHRQRTQNTSSETPNHSEGSKSQPQDITQGYLSSRTEKVNEIDILRDSLLTYYINDIRQVTAEKFVKWRASTLES